MGVTGDFLSILDQLVACTNNEIMQSWKSRFFENHHT